MRGAESQRERFCLTLPLRHRAHNKKRCPEPQLSAARAGDNLPFRSKSAVITNALELPKFASRQLAVDFAPFAKLGVARLGHGAVDRHRAGFLLTDQDNQALAPSDSVLHGYSQNKSTG